MATLVEVGTDRRYTLDERTRIGRDAECEIVVDDPLVSRTHAEIVRQGATYHVRDLGSRRGTYVGERKVEHAELHDGDELLIGPVRMRFSALPETASTAAAAAAAAAGSVDELTRLRAVVELTRAVGVEHDLRRVLDRVLDTCFELFAADRGAIAVYEPPSRTPHVTVARNRSGQHAAFALSTTAVSNVMATGQPHLSTEIDADAALARSASLSVHGVRSLMMVPLTHAVGEAWLGVIQLDSSLENHAFGPRDLELLAAIGSQAALAVQNAMLVRQVRDASEQQWRRLERVLQDLPAGVVVLTRERRCVVANAWVRARASVLGNIERDGIVEELCGVPAERLVDSAQRLQSVHDGRTFELTTHASAETGETVVVLADVTEQHNRLTAEAHRDRLSLLGQLAGGIAHDFNNLLSIILSYANMLEEAIEDPALRADAQTIERAATSASELTRQLLMFSRRELVTPRTVDVAALVGNMDRLLQRTLGARIALVTEIEPGVPRVLIDAAQLEQVVVNLVVNARDAIARDGRVAVRVRPRTLVDGEIGRLPAGRYAWLSVEDTGSGMATEVLAHIFEPYFTTKELHKGTGLGLATVQAIVNQAGGEIVVTTELGRGSLFQIYLPETDRPLDPAREVVVPVSAVATILLVDDDDDVRRMIERVLVRAGYRVLTASSGRAALLAARAHAGPLDLLLTDLVMPGMTGQELASGLVTERPELPVVFMSGYHHGAPIDGDRFVAKPFDRGELLHKVASALAAVAAQLK